MQDSTGKSVAPRFGVNGPRSGSGRAEQAKSFHFAVTWTSVAAHLNLIEAVAVNSNQATLAAVAAVAVLPPIQKPQVQPESSARWEMVVPKMDRVNRIPQVSTNVDPDARQLGNGDVYPPPSIPALAGILNTQPAPFLTRAFALMGRRGRASKLQLLQLNAPGSPSPDDKPADRHAGRELLLSKITQSLRSRSHGWPQTRIQDDPEESALL